MLLKDNTHRLSLSCVYVKRRITSRRSRAKNCAARAAHFFLFCLLTYFAFDALAAVTVVVTNISYYFTVTDAPLGRLVSPAV